MASQTPEGKYKPADGSMTIICKDIQREVIEAKV
jgi:hypothetical protein